MLGTYSKNRKRSHYGRYGGIGYYHVSDTYIALFSHFIPCDVWEAVYILDALLNNTSDQDVEIIFSKE
ncbi:Tn3 family transposase [Clostridium sp. YIM B02555]|uniref:Tn3 family transposase n=1 Tax=Clostridium sp. YIM B02555 TaxID=2911968 RepID=UPI0031B641DC